MENYEDKTQTNMILSKGAKVGHYQIVKRIGAGGMGEVYLAKDTKLDREVAIKFIPQNVADDKEKRERLIREAKAAAKLHHPNIVTIYDVEGESDRPYFVMEHVEGESLQSLLSKEELNPELSLQYVSQIAAALVEVHNSGIIHRDIKPGNIVIDNNSQARLLDFGLARNISDEKLTREGTALGTFAYMSPEQVEGKIIDHRTDIYSLGVTLYQLLSGRLPFDKENAGAAVNAILNEELPAITKEGAAVSSQLQELINVMTAKRPEDRFNDAGELKNAIESVLKNESFAQTEKETSIAVLPFANMSADAEQEYFCDGIAEDIINDLTQVPGLRVVARTSAFAFKNKNEDIRRIGQRLNVGHVLEGSVRKSGDRVRITAQLIKVSDGFHLWSDKYDKKLDDIFAIQDEISRTIVETLKLKLSKKEESDISISVVPIPAYQLYSQGRYNLNLRTAAGFKTALACFEQAIKIFPEYALAHTGVADSYFLLFAYDLMEPREAISRARHFVHQAIAINPKQSEAPCTLGGILAYYDWAWDEAEDAFRKSLEYGPGYATAHQWYGEILAYRKKTEEAEKRLLKAHEMDPLSTIILTMLGCVYLLEARPQEALNTLFKAYEIGTDNDATYAGLGFTLMSLGKNDEALQKFDEGCRRSNYGSYSIMMRAHGFALNSNLEETKKAITELEKRREKEYVPEAYLATLYLDIGDEKRGIAWLERAIRRHNTELIFMAVMPYYANIRKNANVQTLLSVVGLTH